MDELIELLRGLETSGHASSGSATLVILQDSLANLTDPVHGAAFQARMHEENVPALLNAHLETHLPPLAAASTLGDESLPPPPPPSSSSSSSPSSAELISLIFWNLVRMCRRELDKSTSHEGNLLAIGKFAPSLLLRLHKAHSMSSSVLENPKLALAVCWLVMVLASDNDEHAEAMSKDDSPLGGKACELVATIMQMHAENEEIAEFACRATRNLANNDEAAAQCVTDGMCEKLVAIMNLYSMSSSPKPPPSIIAVLDAALWACTNLACDENIAKILGAAGGIDALCACLELLVSPLSSSSSSSDSCRSESGSRAACWTLRNMSCAGALNLSLLIASKETICRLVLKALEEFPSNQDLAEAGVWAIANMACEKQLVGQLHDLGAELTVLATARNLAIDLPACRRRVSVSAAAAAGGGRGSGGVEGGGEGEETEEERDARHMQTGPVAEACLWAIRNLCVSNKQSSQDVLGEAGACDVIVPHFLCEYLHRPGMFEVVCETLLLLVLHHKENTIRFLSSGARTCAENGSILGVVMDGIATHIEEEDVHEPAFKLLATCARQNSDIALPYLQLKRKLLGDDEEAAAAAAKLEEAEAAAGEGGGEGKAAAAGLAPPPPPLPSSFTTAAASRLAIRTMRRHFANGDLIGAGCELLLQVHYVEEHQREDLLARGLIVYEGTAEAESSEAAAGGAGGGSKEVGATRRALAIMGGKNIVEVSKLWRWRDIMGEPPLPIESEVTKPAEACEETVDAEDVARHFHAVDRTERREAEQEEEEVVEEEEEPRTPVYDYGDSAYDDLEDAMSGEAGRGGVGGGGGPKVYTQKHVRAQEQMQQNAKGRK